LSWLPVKGEGALSQAAMRLCRPGRCSSGLLHAPLTGTSKQMAPREHVLHEYQPPWRTPWATAQSSGFNSLIEQPASIMLHGVRAYDTRPVTRRLPKRIPRAVPSERHFMNESKPLGLRTCCGWVFDHSRAPDRRFGSHPCACSYSYSLCGCVLSPSDSRVTALTTQRAAAVCVLRT
jgi:hypothetical protein